MFGALVVEVVVLVLLQPRLFPMIKLQFDIPVLDARLGAFALAVFEAIAWFPFVACVVPKWKP